MEECTIINDLHYFRNFVHYNSLSVKMNLSVQVNILVFH